MACAAAALSVLLPGCAASSASRSAPSPAPVSPRRDAVLASASADFALGREAALSGDPPVRRSSISAGRSRPSVPRRPSRLPSPELAAFSTELYEGILRYEALAAPIDETAAAESHVSPELEKIETPIEASQEAISEAASAVASDVAGVTYDIPIVVNEGVLKILATFQHDLTTSSDGD